MVSASYEQFKDEVFAEMQHLADLSDSITELILSEAVKLNDQHMDAIRATFSDGTNCSPTIYPESLYEEFKAGESIEDIAQKAVEMIEVAHRSMPAFDMSTVNQNAAPSHVYLQLVNAEMNQDLMNRCAYVELNDLVGIPRWSLDIGNDKGSFVVSHDVQTQMLHMTDEELLAIARANTINQEFTIKGMSEVMKEMMGADMPQEFVAEMFPPEQDEPMYVLTNEEKTFGANALLSPDTLEAVKDKIGEDNYYIIPSSIHEVLVVPESKVADPADLQAMCKEVNANEVSPKERLGENIYRYDGEKQTISICNSLSELREQTEKPVVEHNVEHHPKMD